MIGALLSATLAVGGAAPRSPGPAASAGAAERRAGPAGSVLLVESNRTVPLVHVVVASRSGAAADPRHREGLTNLAAEWARHGAGGKAREDVDAALDALGATLDVTTLPDSTRFEGEVLTRNLDAYLALVADVLVRPNFAAAELDRTRREVIGQIDELRNDDRALAGRFFVRNLYADHPYGHPADGVPAAMESARPEEISAHFRKHFVGKNMVFAFAGDVDADALAATLKRTFKSLAAGPAPEPNALELREPVPPKGWRIQLVDKPDRQQTQLLFGHPAVRATDPDFLPLTLGLTAFGGHAMNATMMSEIRRKRGLAYGAYLTLGQRQDRDDAEAGAEAVCRVHGQGSQRRRRRVLQAIPDRVSRVRHGRARAPARRTRVGGGGRPAAGLRRHLSRAHQRVDRDRRQRRDQAARARTRSGDHDGRDRPRDDEAARRREGAGNRDRRRALRQLLAPRV